MHIIAGDQRQTEVDNWESGEVFAIGASRDQYSSGLTKDWIPLCRKGKSKFIVISRRALAQEGDYEMMPVWGCVRACVRACVS